MEYTTKEVFEKLFDNENLEFECIYGNRKSNNADRKVLKMHNGYFFFERYFDGIQQLTPCGQMNGNVHTSDKWTLIQKPVDFMTAANSSKKIKLFYPEEYTFLIGSTCLKTYNYLNTVLNTMRVYPTKQIKQLLNAKWLIED